MLGKLVIKKKEADRFAVACDLADIVIRDNRVVGDEVSVQIAYKNAESLAKYGGYMVTLPADAKLPPAPAKADKAK